MKMFFTYTINISLINYLFTTTIKNNNYNFTHYKFNSLPKLI